MGDGEFFSGWGTFVFGRIAASFLYEHNPFGKGFPKGLVTEAPKGSCDYRLLLLMRVFFLFFFLTRAPTCSLTKGKRKLIIATDRGYWQMRRDFALCCVGDLEEEGKCDGGKFSSL